MPSAARRFLSEHAAVSATLAILVLLAALAVLFWALRPANQPIRESGVFFYDLNTGQLYTAAPGTEPPIAAPSGDLPDGGPAGVRAFAFSCDGAAATDRRFGYVETKAPDGRLIRAPFSEGAPYTGGWVPADSLQGQQLADPFELRKRCGVEADAFDEVLPR